MTGARHRRRWSDDHGSSDALGLALLAPATIGLALVVLFLSRGVDTRATAQSAAEAAAQAAVQERTPAAARIAGEAAGHSMLVDATTCSSATVSVDTSDFRPGGVVVVSVACTTSISGLEAIDPPTRDPFVGRAIAYVDPFRGTDP